MPFPNDHGGHVAIQGRVYHRVRPTHGNSPVKWILMDGMQMQSIPDISSGAKIPNAWKDAVRVALYTHNPIARGLLYIHQYASQVSPDAPPMSLLLRDPGSSSEIAALMTMDNTALSDIAPRSVMVISRTSGSKKLSVISPLWEPLLYPLLFPFGDLGWGVPAAKRSAFEQSLLHELAQDVSDTTSERTHATQLWFYRLRLLREPRFRMFGRLANEWLVDMFSRNLDCRLDYINTNLNRIRDEAESRLREEEHKLMEDKDAPPAENVYLPASFHGSIRWSQERTADALAVASALGGPTMFITMTCNTNWEEITEKLRPGQEWQDIPDVVARVFKRKLTELINELQVIFPGVGCPVYIIHRIEFQKRGAPHAHILVRYPKELTTPGDIDQVISAEMPDDPLEAQLVRDFMTHNHTGTKLSSYCDPHGKGSCRHRYPQALSANTSIGFDGRVQYRRRNPGDAWVVAYCPALLRRFRSHINVEWASTSHLFQYLFKYVNKGKSHLASEYSVL
jgi:hypothetical protein